MFLTETMIYESNYMVLTILNCTKENRKCSHYLGIIFLIETMISESIYILITILNFLVLHYCHMLDRTYLSHYHLWHHHLLHWYTLLDNIGISTRGLVIRTYFRKVQYILLLYVTVRFVKLPHFDGNLSIIPRSFNVSTYLWM